LRGQTEERDDGKRQAVQEPHRWLQPAAVSNRSAEGKSAQLLFLFQRRWRCARYPIRQLETRVHGATLSRDAAGMGRTVYAAARAEDIQLEDRSLRACGHHVQHLLRLALVQYVL